MATRGQSAAAGTAWAYVQAWLGKGLTACVFFCLGRLLGPEDFGVFAIVSLVTVVSELFVEQAVSQAVIQDGEGGLCSQTALFFVAIVLGAGLSLCVFSSASLVADLYGNREIAGFMRVASVCPLLCALTAVPVGLLRKTLDYELLTRRTLAANIVSGGVAVGCALKGLGALALVLQAVVYQVVSAVYLIRAGGGGRVFGGPITGVGRAVWLVWVNVVSRCADLLETKGSELILGKMIDLHAAGLYSFAQKAVQTAGIIFAMPLLDAAWGLLSRNRSDKEALRGSLRSLSLVLAFVSLPALLFVATAGGAVLAAFLGTKWQGMVEPLSVLCVAMCARLFLYLMGVSVQVLNPSLKSSVISMCRAFAFLVCLWCFVKSGGGILSAPVSYMLAGVVFLYPVYSLLRGVDGVGAKIVLLVGLKVVPLVAVFAGAHLCLFASVSTKWSGLAGLLGGAVLVAVYAVMVIGVCRSDLRSLLSDISRQSSPSRVNGMVIRICNLIGVH